MATNYQENADKIVEGLSTVSNEVKDIIAKALGTANANVVEVAALGKADLQQNAVVNVTGGGNVDLSKASAADIKALKAVVFSGDADVNLTISNNNFKGTVVLGDGDGKVQLKTNKDVAVETGAGNDSVATGSGKDTVVIAGGNDSVNTGSGNDTVKIQSTFDNADKPQASIDGGSGTNTLNLSDVVVSGVTIDKKGVLTLNLDGGATVTAKNFKALDLGDNGSDLDLSSAKTALNVNLGTGNDTISLGAGKDSVSLTGGDDSISLGAGSDIVKLAMDFSGVATIDGGSGTDKVDLSNMNITSVEKSGTTLTVTLDNGSVLELTSVEQFVYDSNGEAAGGIKTVGITTLDAKF